MTWVMSLSVHENILYNPASRIAPAVVRNIIISYARHCTSYYSQIIPA